VRMRRISAVADPAFIDGAGQWPCLDRCRVHGQRTPSARTTSTVLRMPSSWKPQPQ
jgi:hypothetical protein